MSCNAFELLLLGLGVFALCVLLVITGNKSVQNHKQYSQQQKTQYMQLCADEGISAFNCLNNWMEIQP